MQLFTTKQEVVDKVLHDYMENDVELSSLFFDFPVKMKKSEILDAYQLIVRKVNDDELVRKDEDGIETSLDEIIASGEYADNFEGNCMYFLEGFNETRELVRIAENEIVDFIF